MPLLDDPARQGATDAHIDLRILMEAAPDAQRHTLTYPRLYALSSGHLYYGDVNAVKSKCCV